MPVTGLSSVADTRGDTKPPAAVGSIIMPLLPLILSSLFIQLSHRPRRFDMRDCPGSPDCPVKILAHLIHPVPAYHCEDFRRISLNPRRYFLVLS